MSEGKERGIATGCPRSFLIPLACMSMSMKGVYEESVYQLHLTNAHTPAQSG